MASPQRPGRTDWLYAGVAVYVLAAVGSLLSGTQKALQVAVVVTAVTGFLSWTAVYRRYRQVADLPTSKVASAAQGYVELFGRAELIDGVPVVSKLTGLPCCWYRYSIQRKNAENKWEFLDSGESNEHFFLADDTGRCVISPEGAEVSIRNPQSWYRGDHYYIEWLLLPKSPVYAIGEFSTMGGAVAELDEKNDVGELLADWKADRPALLKRFDLDADGKIDMREWELARIAAQREVRMQHAEIRSRDGMHLLQKPADGRLFLLADELPKKLAARYRVWSWAHLAAFGGACITGLLLR